MLSGGEKADPGLNHGNGHGIHRSQGKKREFKMEISHDCIMCGQILQVLRNPVFSSIIFTNDCGKTGFITGGGNRF